MKTYRIRNHQLQATRVILAEDATSALDLVGWRGADCFVMPGQAVAPTKTPTYFETKLSSYNAQINVLLLAVRNMSADYDVTWGRDRLVSITLTHVETALSNAHGWALEAQRQLKEQEDANV